MTPEKFCKLRDEDINSLTFKQMKEIVKSFRQSPSTAHYFEGCSKKCKQMLGYHLQRTRRTMAIDWGYR